MIIKITISVIDMNLKKAKRNFKVYNGLGGRDIFADSTISSLDFLRLTNYYVTLKMHCKPSLIDVAYV